MRYQGCEAVLKVNKKTGQKIPLLFNNIIIRYRYNKILKWWIDLTCHVDTSFHLDPSCWSACASSRGNIIFGPACMESSYMTKRESKIFDLYLSINKRSQLVHDLLDLSRLRCCKT
jgi:hypothetical protein